MTGSNTVGKSDAILVISARSGDAAAFSELVERHLRAVFVTCMVRLQDRDSAEDLAQEVMVRAYLHLDQLTDGSRFAAWVCSIARNLAEDWRRQNRRRSRLLPMVHLDMEELARMPDTIDTPRDAAAATERGQAVHAALAVLPPELREIVLFYYVEELSERDIAQRMGLHRTTVRYHRLRAMQSLRTGSLQLLREAAGTLHCGLAAAPKAIAATSALAAMSAQSRRAIAAASQSSMPTAIVPAPIVPLLGSILKVGVVVMNSKTITAALAVACVLGGTAYYKGTWKPLPTQPFDVTLVGGGGLRSADTEAALHKQQLACACRGTRILRDRRRPLPAGIRRGRFLLSAGAVCGAGEKAVEVRSGLHSRCKIRSGRATMLMPI